MERVSQPYRQPPVQFGAVIKAAIAALLLHVVLLTIFAWLYSKAGQHQNELLLRGSLEEAGVEIDLSQLLTAQDLVTLRDQLVEPLKPVEREAKKPEPEAEKTREEPDKQLASLPQDASLAREEAPLDPKFQGAFNTVAASENEPTPDGQANLPSQDGEIFERSKSLVESNFREESKLNGVAGEPGDTTQEMPPSEADQPTEAPPEKLSEITAEAKPDVGESPDQASDGPSQEQKAKPLTEATAEATPQKPSEQPAKQASPIDLIETVEPVIPPLPADKKLEDLFEANIQPALPEGMESHLPPLLEPVEPDPPMEPGSAEKVPDRPEPLQKVDEEPDEPSKEDQQAEELAVDKQAQESNELVELESKAAEAQRRAAREQRLAAMQKFESEKRLTKISGTISKRGKSSLDSKSTELGKYWDRVSKEVETVWQKEALANREFNMPGSLRVSFVIAPSGNVSHIRINSRAGASSIQQSYTVNAIKKAKIPRMPPSLVKELYEESVEMQITFNF